MKINFKNVAIILCGIWAALAIGAKVADFFGLAPAESPAETTAIVQEL